MPFSDEGNSNFLLCLIILGFTDTMGFTGTILGLEDKMIFDSVTVINKVFYIKYKLQSIVTQ